MKLARTDNDTWDLATSVGATATSVAELFTAHGLSAQTGDADEEAMFTSLAYVAAGRT